MFSLAKMGFGGLGVVTKLTLKVWRCLGFLLVPYVPQARLGVTQFCTNHHTYLLGLLAVCCCFLLNVAAVAAAAAAFAVAAAAAVAVAVAAAAAAAQAVPMQKLGEKTFVAST